MSETASKATAEAEKKPHEPRDMVREVLETIVFVVVLVLLLQLFVAQAFVIPTGSMATTLLGNHKLLECDQCKYRFTVNAADEVEEGGPPKPYVCPNCAYRYEGPLQGLPIPDGGDRVIVSKPAFDVFRPKRFDVPVFKFPGDSSEMSLDSIQAMGENPHVPGDIRTWIRDNPRTPIDGPIAPDWERRNYIKRLIGNPGETIAIGRGDLFSSETVAYPDDRFPPPPSPEDAWKHVYMYPQSFSDYRFLGENGFRILRKPPSVLMQMKRIVHDNQFQPERLKGKVPPRWWPQDAEWPAATGPWQLDDANAPREFSHAGGETGWIVYRHLVPKWFKLEDTSPGPIRDFLGYNFRGEGNWVRDLILECEVDLRDANGEVTLEVAESADRFQAVFRPAEGKCVLRRLTIGREPVQFAEADSPLKSAGKYRLRLANVDDRITVWVGSKVLDFGGANDYETSPEPERFEDDDTDREGWVRANDIDQPARVGVKGSASVGGLRLWRDTFYTNEPGDKLNTYFIQPGHYFCLGDNSAASADSRSWGLVPERLLIGRALLVYYPFSRIGLIE